MKKLTQAAIVMLLLTATGQFTFAKKVKFAVDMSNETPSPNGVHIAGDFQLIAGYAEDWCAGCTPLTQEGGSAIYSIVLDLPAFHKYEFKFINGDQFYESEFVPQESRVQYDFNDNRWIFVDSIANDTTFAGNIVFASNAPLNKYLVRFYVDMKNETLSTNGVHLAGSFNNWDASKIRMYHFDNAPENIFEIIQYTSATTLMYKYYNGNTANDAEIVPTACGGGMEHRMSTINADVLLDIVCFSSCSACVTSAIPMLDASSFSLFPNPGKGHTILQCKSGKHIKQIAITDMQGRLIQVNINPTSTWNFNTEAFNGGIYYVTVLFEDNTSAKASLIVN
jgi:hypothetical protein